MFTVEVVLAQ